MLWLVVLFLLGAMIASRRTKGPIWAMAIAWLVSIVPVASGAVIYKFFNEGSPDYALTLFIYLGCYFAGGFLWRALPRSVLSSSSPSSVRRDLLSGQAVTAFVWWVAIGGSACVLIDFFVSGGPGLDDLAALRDQIVGSKGASTLAQIGSVLTWACLYCYIFALGFRALLGPRRFLLMLLPIAGYFMLSVVSAGRQAAFQIMIVALLVTLQNQARRRALREAVAPVKARAPRSLSRVVAGFALVAAMTGYMGYVAVTRVDGQVSDDKGTIILNVFKAEISDQVDRVISAGGPQVRSAIVEGIVYFTSPVALFQNFLSVPIRHSTYGALSVPFLFRQVQGLTGIVQMDTLNGKVDRLSASSVIGSGWTTGMSSFIEDFGPVGALVVLFGLGFYSEAAWDRACRSHNLNDAVVGIVVLLIAIYMPLIFAFSDTNILLMWAFAVALQALSPRRQAIDRSASALSAA